MAEAETPLYDLLLDHLNAGEASCLAIAVARGCRVFTDDRDARELAARWRVPISGTLGLLIRLVDLKVLSLSEAEVLLVGMITAGYRSPAISLQELL